MGAGVEIAWVDEEGKLIKLLSDTEGVIASLAATRWPHLSGTACLRFVDPWGDTVFNQSQLSVLLAELRIELADPGNSEHAGHLLQVVRLVEGAQDQVHTYIKFIGD